jgi:hemoglobin
MLDPENSAYMRQSLYRRLGGYEVIAAFVADLMPRLRRDPTLAVYWKGKSLGGQRREDQLLVEFLVSAFEGPAYYAGRDMKTSHEGLGITEEEWAILLVHIAASLDGLGVAEREKAEFIQCADGLKWDIVEPARPAAG